MPNYNIVNFRTTDFDEDITHEFQQNGAKLEGTYREEALIGQSATFNILGKSEAKQSTVMFGDTPEPPELQNIVRVAIPVVWDDTAWIDPHEWDNSMATTGKLPARYARNLSMSLGRAKDRTVLNALIGDAVTQTINPATTLPSFDTTEFPPENILPDNGLPFMVDKLIDAVQMLEEDEAHNGRIWCVVVPRQRAQLMRDTNFTSFDFNTERPLVNGYRETFYGINFIWSSLLMNLSAVHSDTVDTAIMWNEDAVGFKRQEPITTEISLRPDKKNLVQLYTHMSGGFTRIQDEGVIQIKTLRAA